MILEWRFTIVIMDTANNALIFRKYPCEPPINTSRYCCNATQQLRKLSIMSYIACDEPDIVALLLSLSMRRRMYVVCGVVSQ